MDLPVPVMSKFYTIDILDSDLKANDADVILSVPKSELQIQSSFLSADQSKCSEVQLFDLKNV